MMPSNPAAILVVLLAILEKCLCLITPSQALHIVPAICSPEDEAQPTCNDQDKFRTINGRCNNLAQPFWGSTGIKLVRWAEAAYQDGRSVPRGGWLSTSDHDYDTLESANEAFDNCDTDPYRPLPNPRQLSTKVHTTGSTLDPEKTHMLTHFGQLLAHDTDWTPEQPMPTPDCCHDREGSGPRFDEVCFPLFVPTNDRYSKRTRPTAINVHARNHKCWNFRRSIHCDSEEAPREQANLITAFVDASFVYGSDDSSADALREKTDGLLATSNEGRALPQISKGGNLLYVAGDDRVRVIPGLTAMHTLFVLEHNRIAVELKNVNGAASDETLYQVARRILIAELQNIVYGPFLRAIVGDAEMTNYNLDAQVDSEYDAAADPSISNVFSTAAFRYGHSMIPGQVYLKRRENGRTDHGQGYNIKDNYKDPTAAKYNAKMDNILYTMIDQKSQKCDLKLKPSIRDFLFLNVEERTGNYRNVSKAIEVPDLAARNVQRGREHGLPSWNAYRKLCGLTEACDWDKPPSDVRTDDYAKLQQVYMRPADVDIFSGGLAEAAVEGGVVGPTFACLLGKQFELLKSGDRFFFSHTEASGNPNAFSSDKLADIRLRTLGDIMCDNIPEMPYVTEDVFVDTARKSCATKNAIDFSNYADELE